ncbi:uncharacterized protein LOC119080484 [Bradysia coprophila]|uniref:uncharacterized protein LOC119080484 n=1 Tax=Bradysia coprophila TaxID=38358 RepID=UPI00187D6FB7|nr:uncharacterized protein LOC119080484 [Bradysia coprophila]
MFSKNQINTFKSKAFHKFKQQVNAMNHALLELSVKIKPDEDIIRESSSYAQKIAEILKVKSVYKIDRFFFAGSFGKRTNTIQSDVDCVYFINGHLPPFEGILREFYDICNQASVKKSFNSFEINLNKKSINFEINGREMVLATNFAMDFKKHRSKRHHQQMGVLEQIKLNPAKNCYQYSSALAESTLFFMKSRVSFANEMARISKCWFQAIGRDFHISGASTFIELVAVYAARKNMPYLKAFIRFLEELMNFEKLDVSFNSFRAISKDHKLANHALPRVIDPVNPYHNFAGYWCDKVDDIQALKRSAAFTMERIQQLVLDQRVTDNEDLVKSLLHQPNRV